MKKIIVVLVSVFSLFTTSSAKDIVENGSFKKELKNWELGVTKKYGQELKPTFSRDGIEFVGIDGPSPKYVTLSQYIDLKKGETYKLTFSAKANDGVDGKATVQVGRPGFARPKQNKEAYDHLKSQKIKLGSEWKTYEFTFTTIYKTDNKDATDEDFKASVAKKEWLALKTDPGKAPTQVCFNLGALQGDFSLKEVQISVVKK